MDYKKIISNQSLRFAILKALSFIPDKQMLAFQYYIKMNRWPDLKNPERFTEKLQVYKMKYRNTILHQCVDKYEVRKFVESKGLKSILNELYGVYSSSSEIDFQKLPNRFVIKTTDGGGGENIILCRDKKEMDTPSICQRIDTWLNKKEINAGREWAYTGIKKSKIIIEQYLESNDTVSEGIADYKILCFHGNPEIIILDVDRYTGHKRNFYDCDWHNLHITSDCPAIDRIIPQPANLEELIKTARILSQDFPFVRVDLYNIEEHIYFGELTFYPWSGYVQFSPDSFDIELGKLFDIPPMGGVITT